MRFQWPLALVALGIVPVLAALYWLWDGRRRAGAARFANPSLLPNLVDRSPGRLRHLPLVIFLVAVTAMVVGVARPHATVNVPREEATVVLVIDSSRSMAANDVTPTRLGAAKNAAKAFVAKVPSKFRIGLVTFATRAVATVPPTANRDAIAAGLDSLRPNGGTALGDAVVLATQLGQRQRTRDGKVPPEAILLISDGAVEGGRTTLKQAEQKATSLHVPVYTIVVGTQNGVVKVPMVGGYTATKKVPPNPTDLRQLASATGGQSFTATDDKRLRAVYEGLGSRLGSAPEDREITDWFAGGSAVLLVASGLLSTFFFRRIL